MNLRLVIKVLLNVCPYSLTEGVSAFPVAALLADFSNYRVICLRLAPPLAIFFAARKALRNEWKASLISALVCVGTNHLRAIWSVVSINLYEPKKVLVSSPPAYHHRMH
eukprot:376498-Prorocentrum_minimum.AAC.2